MSHLSSALRSIFLSLAALSAGPALSQPVAPDADPALWVVRDADTTIYLFGTVHALPSGITWFDDGVRAAFDASDELVVEVTNMEREDPLALLDTYARAHDGRTMAQRLDPDQRARYVRAVARAGIPAQALDQVAPWYVANILSSRLYRGSGGRTVRRALGVEEILEPAARHRNMPITDLETVDMQMGIFAHLSMPAQVELLMAAVDGTNGDNGHFNEILAAWVTGNDQLLGELDRRNLSATPELMENLLTTRNQRWAQWIALRLDEPGGKFFVAVGAAHLAGPESVQRYLGELGITVERVRY